MTEILMFTGKGGVGKTTMAVAAARQAAAQGETLLISTDPSGSLSRIFSRPLDQQVISVEAGLDVVELTRKLVLQLWRDKFADDIYTVLSSFLPVGREIIDYIEGAPGIDEEFMLDYLLTAARAGRYRRIVWDTAPTVTTLNLLFVQQLFYSHLTQAQKIYLKIKKVFHQVDPLALIDQWRRLTADIISLLRQNTQAWVVANPEELPVSQALDIVAGLDGFGIKAKGYILNKMLTEEICEHPFWRRRLDDQRHWRDHLRARAVSLPLIEVPQLNFNHLDLALPPELAKLDFF